MFKLGTADEFIGLKRRHGKIYKGQGYEWSLKEFGVLFAYDTILSTDSRDILEFGCGYNLAFSNALKGTGRDLTMLDNPASNKGIGFDSTRLDDTVAGARANGHHYFRGLLGDGSLPDASFDLIFSVSVVEHIDDAGMAAGARDAMRLLRPGGRLVNSIDIYPRSTRHMVWHQSCLDAGLSVPQPHALNWQWDGHNTTFIERTDVRYLIYNSLGAKDVMESGLRYNSHFATVLHVAVKP